MPPAESWRSPSVDESALQYYFSSDSKSGHIEGMSENHHEEPLKASI